MGAPHIVVDGSNIATEGRSLPSLQQLLDAVAAAEKELEPATVTVIVDATFGHRIDESEKAEYDERTSTGQIITPPAGVIGRGDAFILEVADRADAVVLSNDSFQEFHGEYKWLFDEGRLLGGKHVPGVGWIFLARSPVRGPASRKAVSEAKRKRRGSKKAEKSGPKKKSARSKAAGTGAKSSEAKSSKSSRSSKASKAKAAAGRSEGGGKQQRKSGGKEPEPYNEPLPFIEFVGAHAVGSVVTGEVEQFSSHGAYVVVDGTRCYIPLKAMADPAPRSARDVLTVGESREFVVDAVDTPRRGIDLAVPGMESGAPDAGIEDEDGERMADSEPQDGPGDAAPVGDEEKLSVSQRRKLRAQKAAAAEEASTEPDPARETMAAKKQASKKRASKKKAPARKKAPAKKTTAAKKKSTAKRSPAKKAPAKKTTASKKKAPAKKKAAATKKKASTGSRKKASPAKKSTKKR